jgi:vacuolar-type H+-ATPase subunit I/STV1
MRFRNLISGETYSIIALIITGLSMHLWGADKVLDAKLFYTMTQAESFFRSLEPSQWQAYLLNEVLDLGFLSSYSLLFFSFARKFYSANSWLAFIPGIFDLIETTTIILLLLNRSWSPPIWLGYVTCLKWVTGGIVGILIVVGFTLRKKQANISVP